MSNLEYCAKWFLSTLMMLTMAYLACAYIKADIWFLDLGNIWDWPEDQRISLMALVVLALVGGSFGAEKEDAETAAKDKA